MPVGDCKAALGHRFLVASGESMHVEQFALQAFEQASNPVFREELARQLRRAIEADLAPVVERVLLEVTAKLNQVGHRLAPYGQQSATELHYRDTTDAGDFRLLVACDVVVTTAFRSQV